MAPKVIKGNKTMMEKSRSYRKYIERAQEGTKFYGLGVRNKETGSNTVSTSY